MGEGEGGMIWENGIETCILSCKKRITSLGSMQDTGCLGLVHWDDPEIEPISPALAARFFTAEPPGMPVYYIKYVKNTAADPGFIGYPHHPSSVQFSSVAQSCPTL